jgi:hypothetical protein
LGCIGKWAIYFSKSIPHYQYLTPFNTDAGFTVSTPLKYAVTRAVLPNIVGYREFNSVENDVISKLQEVIVDSFNKVTSLMILCPNFCKSPENI